MNDDMHEDWAAVRGYPSEGFILVWVHVECLSLHRVSIHGYEKGDGDGGESFNVKYEGMIWCSKTLSRRSREYKELMLQLGFQKKGEFASFPRESIIFKRSEAEKQITELREEKRFWAFNNMDRLLRLTAEITRELHDIRTVVQLTEPGAIPRSVLSKIPR
jgi:hypothetical protein